MQTGKSISRSMDPLDDDTSAVVLPQTVPPPSQPATWAIPSVEDIVARAMGAVERATTPHLLATRPSSRAISTAPDRAPSARVWSFDDMLPMLLTALHVQRVVHAAEVDLLQVMGDTVMFNFGPDDLPGLRALQLVHHRPPAAHVRAGGAIAHGSSDSVTREFRVSLEEYHNRIYSEENAEIFDYRSMKRRVRALRLSPRIWHERSTGKLVLLIRVVTVTGDFAGIDPPGDHQSSHLVWQGRHQHDG